MKLKAQDLNTKRHTQELSCIKISFFNQLKRHVQ